MAENKINEKLRMWQERLKKNESAYDAEEAKMDGREALYAGTDELKPITKGSRMKRTTHVRNVCAELIEAETDSNIPQPKVTARRQKDERKAKIIEDMLRNELDRMPFETMNDIMERTVPIQGGAAFLVEWDNTKRTHETVGELAISTLHPKQIVPQDGVYTGIEDMDYIILKLPQTKEYIRRKYNKDVSDEGEQEPEVRGSGGDSSADDLVTQYVAYYRNDDGGIGLYSWVNDTELEDLEDYQARRLRRCANCGAVEPIGEDTEGPTPGPAPTPDNGLGLTEPGGLPGMGSMEGLEMGLLPEDLLEPMGTPMEKPEPKETTRSGRKVCPVCGGTKWEASQEEYEEIYNPILCSDGTVIPGAQPQVVAVEGEYDEAGNPVIVVEQVPTRVPFYKPDIYPVILQKNVSVYGRFLGDSDLDKITSQQNTINRIEAKIIDKLLKSGSYITLPDSASIRVDDEDMKVIRPGTAADKNLIGVFDLQGDVEYDLIYLNQVYEEARQIIGITDSYQGRNDSTATSGTAKEFAAAQSAGRLESKRVMKDAAYAALFEAMFKFKLAYTDEPRTVVTNDLSGNTQYETFNRYDFLEQDAAGEWHWNDQFLFSCDTSAPLASNREAMWQETRMNLQTGAFGDPGSTQTLVLFWSKMEMLHYPGAGETKAYLEEILQQQQMQAQMLQELQQVEQVAAARGSGTGSTGGSTGVSTATAEQNKGYSTAEATEGQAVSRPSDYSG